MNLPFRWYDEYDDEIHDNSQNCKEKLADTVYPIIKNIFHDVIRGHFFMFSIDVSRRFDKRSYINFLHFLYFKLVNCFCLWQLNILKISCNSWTNIANTKSEFKIWCRCLYASLCCYRLSEVYDTTSINLCIFKDDSPVNIYLNNSSIFNFNIFVAFYFLCSIRRKI